MAADLNYKILTGVELPKFKAITSSPRVSTRKEAIASGETRYLGNPCAKTHDGWRWTGSGNCIICVREKYVKKENPKRGKPKCEFRQAAKDKGQIYYFNGKPCVHGHVVKRRTRTGYCMECQNTRVKEQGRDYSLRTKYDITLAEYNTLFSKQNGVCAICHLPEKAIDKYSKEIRNLAVDHCHDTDKIRGLLCSSCNIGIGNLRHNPELLRNAAMYCEEA